MVSEKNKAQIKNGKEVRSMAAILNITRRSMNVLVNNGLDAEGNTVTKAYAFGNVKPNAEAAVADGYGPCSGDPEMRWALWFLPDPTVGADLYPGGEIIRGKAAWYQIQRVIA